MGGKGQAHRWKEGVNEVICQHQVRDGIGVAGCAEVLAVVPAEGCVDAMVPVQHAAHPIESETIKPAGQSRGLASVLQDQ